MKTLRSPLKAYCRTEGGVDEAFTDFKSQEHYLKAKRSGRITILTKIPLPCFQLRRIRVPFKRFNPTHVWYFQLHPDARNPIGTCITAPTHGRPLSHAPTHAWHNPNPRTDASIPSFQC